jgi:adenine-specific DNA-methyltransferase
MIELVWDGKYKDGKKVAPVRLALPFQTIETVNESVQERQMMLDFFSAGRDSEWRNRLIWGDKKYVLPSLLQEFAGKVDLIYIDPPFATGADFSFTASVPDDPNEDGENGATFVKQPSILEQKAYRDTWGRGLDSFMQWFYETALILRELLSENGSLYLHLDSNAVHYAKVILDEVFGVDNFKNEIIWKRTSARSDAESWGNIHDSILFYAKSGNYLWNTVYQSYDEQYLASKYTNEDSRGRYRTDNLTAAGLRNGDSGKAWKGVDPGKIGGHWKVNREAVESLVSVEEAKKLTTQQKLDLLDQNGFIHWPKKGRNGGQGVPAFKRYLGEGVVIQDMITDIPPVNSQAQERLSYSTQKPEALLERIINASSNPGDLVLDCFCGSGTTAAVAEKLGRRWITCDLGRFAIHTARKRFLGITGVKPFVVQNLGKYERQAWQAAEFENVQDAAAREARYRAFILELYRAQPSSGVWLHGIKGGRMVHVGPVDAPITLADVKAVARETLKLVGTGEGAPETAGADILGWDFAFELNEMGLQIAADAGVNVKFKKIPREVLEKKAVDQGDIKFFELAALTLASSVKGRTANLELRDFIISPDDVPADVMQKITHWSQWVDYWAVDWNYREDTFHNEWQAYRTRKQPKLEVKAAHVYEMPGVYTVLVKVIDLLGNDTTKAVRLEVK